MLPNLDEWDSEFLVSLEGSQERSFVEFKASALLNTDTKKFTKTKDEIAKQACAFANSGGGFVVLGLRDHDGAVDEGVPTLIGGEEIKSWLEKIVPNNTYPPIHTCEAKVIRTPKHQPGRCAVVLHIPLSELRPHWIKDGAKDVPYIRAGEHSLPMPLQTFRDVVGRSESMRAEVASIVVSSGRLVNNSNLRLLVQPQVRLLAGTICHDWLVSLEVLNGQGMFYPHLLSSLPPASYYACGPNRVTVKGQLPLIRGVCVPVTADAFELELPNFQVADLRQLRATLHLPGADSTHLEEGLDKFAPVGGR